MKVFFLEGIPSLQWQQEVSVKTGILRVMEQKWILFWVCRKKERKKEKTKEKEQGKKKQLKKTPKTPNQQTPPPPTRLEENLRARPKGKRE